ncbi:hypothetical protein ACGIF2_06505 [Cellulomonas sp. P22]|uniref:hypothetical protein n=1 Tax=Cellulomonas sp. P22 TaxID=3373189 RepID=UPI0037B68AE8
MINSFCTQWLMDSTSRAISSRPLLLGLAVGLDHALVYRLRQRLQVSSLLAAEQVSAGVRVRHLTCGPRKRIYHRRQVGQLLAGRGLEPP